jgi:hypothetical protein
MNMVLVQLKKHFWKPNDQVMKKNNETNCVRRDQLRNLEKSH